MFCKHCWREIVEDSAFCSYCGKRVDAQEETEKSKKQSSGIRPIRTQSSQPRKRCKSCGKELPASISSNICAMCAIHQRNRELDKARQLEQTKSATPSVHPQPVKSPAPKVTVSDDSSDSPEKKRGCGCLLLILALIFVFILFSVLIPLGASVYEDFRMRQEIEQAASKNTQYAISNPDIDISETLPPSAQETPTGLEIMPKLWILSDEFVPRSQQGLTYGAMQAAFFDMLSTDFSDLFTVNSIELRPDDGYTSGNITYMHGTLHYTTPDGQTHDDLFDFGAFVTPGELLAAFVSLENEILYDIRYSLIDEAGFLTEDGAAYFDKQPDDYLFEEDCIHYEDLPQTDPEN